MTRSIKKMARVSVDLFEPKQVARGRILIRKYGLTDTIVEVNETRAMATLVEFVVFQVIGHRIDRVGWGLEDMLHEKINLLCKSAWVIDWYSHAGLCFDVWYISRRVIRIFLYHVSKK